MEKERRPQTDTYEYRLRSRTLVIHVRKDLLEKDTKDLKWGPCNLVMDPSQYERAYWARLGNEALPLSRYTRRLAYSINKILKYPAVLETIAFLEYPLEEGSSISTIYINPLSFISHLSRRRGLANTQVLIAARSIVNEAYRHEREHADQSPHNLRTVEWLDPRFRVRSRLILGFIDIGGTVINLLCTSAILDSSGYSPAQRAFFFIAPFIASPLVAAGRSYTQDEFEHLDFPEEIEAQNAERCILRSPIFEFDMK